MPGTSALGLTSLLDEPPFLLSGGQKQKLALACVLALEQKLLLLGEPSASLDPGTVGWLIDVLLDTPTTVVAATHNLSLAAELGSRCLVMGALGRLLSDGPVSSALRHPGLLEETGLAHRHRHRHGDALHTHLHTHVGGGLIQCTLPDEGSSVPGDGDRPARGRSATNQCRSNSPAGSGRAK